MSRQLYKWFPEALLALRDAYEGPERIKVIVARFNIGHVTIHRFARRLGWKRRMSAQGIASLTAARKVR